MKIEFTQNGLRYEVIEGTNQVAVREICTDAESITIPEQVEYDGHIYSVTQFDLKTDDSKPTESEWVEIPTACGSVGHRFVKYNYMGSDKTKEIHFGSNITIKTVISLAFPNLQCIYIEPTTKLDTEVGAVGYIMERYRGKVYMRCAPEKFLKLNDCHSWTSHPAFHRPNPTITFLIPLASSIDDCIGELITLTDFWTGKCVSVRADQIQSMKPMDEDWEYVPCSPFYIVGHTSTTVLTLQNGQTQEVVEDVATIRSYIARAQQ